MEHDIYKKSRIIYIIEAALEYFISILVADAYLATLARSIGIKDSVTGIISSFISLGCVFQLIAMFMSRGSAKRTVTVFSVFNQILFMMLYVIPLTDTSDTLRRLSFIICIFVAYFLYNVAHPKKINWLMSLVEDRKRGRFTAAKEIVSLVSGMIFSYSMGATVDHYKEKGDIRSAFIVCGVTIFVLMIMHTVSLLLTKEKPITHEYDGKRDILSVLKDRNLIKVSVVFIIWNIATYSARPFFGTYQTSELGFSFKFISMLGIYSAIARVLASIVLGIYADKRSFAKMIRICFIIAALSFLAVVFCVPENGKVMYTIYMILYAIAMGGINSALINLCYDYVAFDNRVHALALTQALAGLAGFFSTMLFSLIVNRIQLNGNTFFGIKLYAQQVVSAIAFLLTVIVIIYVSISLIKGSKRHGGRIYY